MAPDPRNQQHRECLALGLAVLVALAINALGTLRTEARLDHIRDRLERLERLNRP